MQSNNNLSILKFFFHTANLLIIIFYIYPGNILGWLLYGNIEKEPHLTNDFLKISSNHVYIFIILSFLACLAYFNVRKKNILLFNYLIFLSVILEVLHYFIPQRAFEFGDLFGNVLGVLICFIFFLIYKQSRKL